MQHFVDNNDIRESLDMALSQRDVSQRPDATAVKQFCDTFSGVLCSPAASQERGGR